eukprot:6860959-Heterocapsa_arctica.AAC.1
MVRGRTRPGSTCGSRSCVLGLRLAVPYVGGVLEVWPSLGTTTNRSGLPSDVMAGTTRKAERRRHRRPGLCR